MSIVALNSGGFDSVAMLHDLKHRNEGMLIHTLFFNYGQRAYDNERECALKVCEKLDMEFNEIVLPELFWTKSGLTEASNADVYLEMRNLIFLSYAVSFAQSKDITEIYVAMIEPLGYPDTSYEFIDNMNTLLKPIGIEIIAPFHTYTKEDFIPMVRAYGIRREDFFSCLMTESTEGKLCGNCETLNNMYDNYIDPYYLDDLYFSGNKDKMLEEMQKAKITKVKLSINDSCNLKCTYCLVEGTKTETVDTDSFYSILDKLNDMGIQEIDFFGKEPLFDTKIFYLVDYARLRGYEFKFTFITNGFNLLRYMYMIKPEDFDSFTVSYEGGNEGRNFTPDLELLKQFVDRGHNVNISLDLHKNNYIQVIKEYLPNFDSIGINSVYIKPIIPLGENKKIIESDFYLSDVEFRGIIEEIADIMMNYPNLHVNIGIPFYYSSVADVLVYESDLMTNTYRGLSINHDLYCTSGVNSMFINSNGDIFGCGNMPYSGCKSKLNILTSSKKEIYENIITKGERMCLQPTCL